jgi:uncharacterized membrane protein YphA (DoxX/SURF4 family)
MGWRVKKRYLKNTTIVVSSYLFVFLFLYAAISKLLDFETFTVQLAQSPLLSAYAGFIAWAVPGIEIAIALLLVFERFRLFALYAAFTLMVMFTAYIYIILNFSDFVPCSCGGVLEKLTWTQHLIFNVFFILLAGVAVFFAGRYRPKKTLLLLAALAIIGIGIVAILFAFSEKKIHRNNAFIRRYPHHPIVPKDTVELNYNSYYFGGSDANNLYLGNYTAPKQVTRISFDLKDTTNFRIQLSKSKVQYKMPRVRIIDSTFFLFDGTVPIIHVGKISDWIVTKTFYPRAYFNFAEPLDTKNLVIRTISSETGNNLLGTIRLDSVPKIELFPNILEGNIDGYFDRDGQLHFNRQSNNVIYTYYYKNKYLVSSLDFKRIKTQKTIDTIEKPQIFIDELESSHERRLSGKSIRVNGLSSSFGNYLLIQSDRLGKYEPEGIAAGIIDVYNISSNTYEFSFYLYHNPKEKLLSISIYGHNLYALIDTKLYRFTFKDNFLK